MNTVNDRDAARRHPYLTSVLCCITILEKSKPHVALLGYFHRTRAKSMNKFLWETSTPSEIVFLKRVSEPLTVLTIESSKDFFRLSKLRVIIGGVTT